MSGSVSFKVKTKWIRSGWDISFESTSFVLSAECLLSAKHVWSYVESVVGGIVARVL